MKTILISEEHKEKLDSLKVIPRESYDGVIGRLVDSSNDESTKIQSSEIQKGTPE